MWPDEMEEKERGLLEGLVGDCFRYESKERIRIAGVAQSAWFESAMRDITISSNSQKTQ